jgi:TRAP-type C4-dicarboxylate transport system substrate-binding protein
VASKRVLDRLSVEDQALVRQAAKDSVAFQRAAWDSFVAESMEKVKAAGNTITAVPDNAAFQSAVQGMYDKLSSEDKELVSQIRAMGK